MAKAREILDDIISQLTGENADALKEKLREAKLQISKMEESLADTTKESVSRKEEIRTLKENLQAKESEIEKFNKLNPELESLRKDREKLIALEKQQYETLKSKWTEKAKVFTVDETDKRKPLVDKIKDKFTFGDDKTPLTYEQLTKNLETIEIYESANYFGDVETNPDVPKRPGAFSNDKNEKSSGDATFKFKEN